MIPPIFHDDSDASVSDTLNTSDSSSLSSYTPHDHSPTTDQTPSGRAPTPATQLCSTLTPRTTTPIAIHTNPYTRLRESQDTIGWDHFLRGKLARGWTHQQYVYASKHSLLDDSKHWRTWLIRYMANYSFSIWDTRNKQRHGRDTASNQQKDLIQAHRDIRALYALRDQVLPQDRDLFCASIDAHQLRPLAALCGWLTLNRDLIRFSVRTAALQAKSGTKPISTFFSSVLRRDRTPRKPRPKPTTQKHFRPSRVTKFFTLRTPKPRKKPSNPAIPIPTDSPSHSHPSPAPSSPPLRAARQRLLSDFFPDHPT